MFLSACFCESVNSTPPFPAGKKRRLYNRRRTLKKSLKKITALEKTFHSLPLTIRSEPLSIPPNILNTPPQTVAAPTKPGEPSLQPKLHLLSERTCRISLYQGQLSTPHHKPARIYTYPRRAVFLFYFILSAHFQQLS